MRSARLILEGQSSSWRDRARGVSALVAHGVDHDADETDDAASILAARGVGQMDETLPRGAAEVAMPRAWQTDSAKERQRTRSVMVGQSTSGGSRQDQEIVKKCLDASWAEDVSWKTLAQELETMQVATSDGEGSLGEIRLIDLNVSKVAARLGRLRQAAVVVQIFEIYPSRGRVVAWVQDTIELRLGVAVNQWENRQSIKLTANMKVAWVELRDLPPFLEDQVETMLGVLGLIVHHFLEKQNELKYANVRACILIDVSLDLPQFVGIKTPWEKTYLQPVVFTRLPDRCFLCQGKGAWENMTISSADPDAQAKSEANINEKVTMTPVLLKTGGVEEKGLKLKAKARVGRAPKKKLVERHKGGSLAWLDESINTEDELGGDPCDIDEVQGERRVFGELNLNENRPKEEDSGRLSFGSTGYKRQPLADGLAHVRQVIEDMAQRTSQQADKENGTSAESDF
ncbi:hypothetical protein R1sor_005688 [Riccia sorocarpa]|uniref:DUF4283 domain-containing protein n=1 Tax=Riccia sorocarpa TaxID=122646 RepID=A0ABD3HNU0_9MARC